jgi:hypothetical protein
VAAPFLHRVRLFPSAKEFARVPLFFTSRCLSGEMGVQSTRMMWELYHADKQFRPAKSSSSRHRLYTERHPFFVL